MIDVSRGYFSYLGANILENKFINDVGTLGNTFLYTEQDRGLVLVDDPNFIVGTLYSDGRSLWCQCGWWYCLCGN